MTCRLTDAYWRPSTGTKIAPGQSAAAVRRGMAEWTPNRRASYDAALTTPRSSGPPPPTMTGRPRSSGWSRCSTAAKNASRSTCRMVAPAMTRLS